MRRELRELKGNEGAYTTYLDGLRKLLDSGYITALRAIGRPVRREFGKDSTQMASEAAWSAGWNDCLDSLLHFKEYYFPDEAPAGLGLPDFSAVDLALARGDLTKEESDAIKSGQSIRPDLKSVTRNIPAPKPRPPGA